MNRKVLLGMSGGIDSFIAAVLLLRKGYDVTGVTLLFSENDGDIHAPDYAAKQLARSLGIPHFTFDLTKEFNELIVDYFIKSYQNGSTPFPCVVCNPQLKFKKLKELADERKIGYIATGHYAQIADNKGIKYVKSGIDVNKDQSFFLWGLSRDVLDRVLFPLGELHKREVRDLASGIAYGFMAKKPESMGICFVNNLSYKEFLKKNGVKSIPGNFIDPEGNILGKHKGIVNYTIGQRRGLNLHRNERLFVSEIRPETNEVVLSEYASLYRTKIYLNKIHFIVPDLVNSESLYKVRIRYRKQENACRIQLQDQDRAVIELTEPVAMVAPGQSAVIYDDGRVIGGGFIEFSE